MSCGCGDCNCRVIAGSGAIVTGTGTQSNPFVISANVGLFQAADTDCISMNMDGSGTAGDPFVVSGSIVRNPSGDNLLVCDGDGLLVDCDTVMACVGDNLGCGIEFNNGALCVMISEDDGNQLECRDDGLYAAFDCNDLGCGLTLDGDGNIAVNTGGANFASGKRGLICDPATGILRVDPGCGIDFDPAGRVRVRTPQIRQQNVVGDRNVNLNIPNTVIPAVGTSVTDANGLSTVQNCVVLTNNDCAPAQGHLVFRFQFEAIVGPDRDIEVDIQILDQNTLQWNFTEETFRHYHEQGGRQIFSGFGERTTAIALAAGETRTICQRLMFHRAAGPGDLTGNPAAEARLLSYAVTQQAVLYRNL